MNPIVSPNGTQTSQLSEEQTERLREILWAIQDPEVKQKYPDEFVAVHRRQIIAHGDDINQVLAEAQRITGLPIHQIPVTTIMGPGILFAPRN